MAKIHFTTLSGLALTAGLIAATTTAFAADVNGGQEPIPVAPAAPQSSSFDWTGAYVGAKAGYQHGDDSLDGSSINRNGFTGGVYGGYNAVVAPHVIVDGEADLTYQPGRSSGDATVSSTIVSSLKGRAGYEVQQGTMIYGTAGIAGAKVKASYSGGSDSHFLPGIVVGAGVETAITKNITARAEYDYTNFANKTYNVGGETRQLDVGGHAVTAGLAYKF